jgi:hypothetical protein
VVISKGMKNFIKSLLFLLLVWFQVLVYGAEPEPQGASAAVAASSASAPQAVSSPGAYWLEAHTSVHVDNQYQYLVAILMFLVVMVALEQYEDSPKKKKRR